MPLNPMRFVTASLFLFACGLVAGCGQTIITGEEKAPPTEVEKRLLAIGDAYVRATAKLQKPPANVNDLMPFLKQVGKPEELLKSPEDNKNFEIVFGSNLIGQKATGTEVPIVAFERTGKDGKRNVLRGDRETLLMTEAELRSAKFPDGYRLPF